MWRPGDEAEATGNRAALLEWLRATGSWSDAHPAGLAAFAAGQRHAWLHAIAGFLGLDPADGPVGAIAKHGGTLVVHRGVERRMVDPASHHAVREQGWDSFVADAAGHLLCAETRPDDRLLWLGDPDDPWPIAGLLFGAAVILGTHSRAGPAALAAAEGATVTWSAAQPFPPLDQAASFKSG